MGKVAYDPGRIEAGLVKIEASQKGWALVRAVAGLLMVLGRFEASPEHDWQAYDVAKRSALNAIEQFERWHGREVT